MTIFHTFLAIAQVIAAIAVIILVLLQQGKGADMGAAFGSGSSGSLFGATGSANFLSRATGVCATIFLLCTLGLTFVSRAGNHTESRGVMDSVPSTQVEQSGEKTANPDAKLAPKPVVPATPDVPK